MAIVPMGESKPDNPDFIIEFFQLPIDNGQTLAGMEVVIYAHQGRGLAKGDAALIPTDSPGEVAAFFSRHPGTLIGHLLSKSLLPSLTFRADAREASNSLVEHLPRQLFVIFQILVQKPHHFCIFSIIDNRRLF